MLIATKSAKNQQLEIIHQTLFKESLNYILRLARTQQDLSSAMDLRLEVFHREVAGQTDTTSDHSPLDSYADHLIIESKTEQKVVGTYRLIRSGTPVQFYAENEFALDHVLSLVGSKLELSRACIDKNHRNGQVISMLWSGIKSYARRHQIRYIFGCSSIWKLSKDQINDFQLVLHSQNAFRHDLGVKPKRINPHIYLTSFDSADFCDKKIEKAKKLIPPILGAYLKRGAKLSPLPVFCDEFNCYVYFTFFDLQTDHRIKNATAN